jgi:hypothetical protein
VRCEAGARCEIECTGSCNVDCRGAASCTLRCGTAAMRSVTGTDSCS